MRDRARRHRQSLTAYRHLQRFEIPRLGRVASYEARDLLRKIRLERRAEPPFSRPAAAVSSWASALSARCSHAAQYSSVASRNSRPAAIWRRTVSTWAVGIRRVCVVPATVRVQLK
jgi:hypothetical protein